MDGHGAQDGGWGWGTDTKEEEREERWPRGPRGHIAKMAELYRDWKLGDKGSLRFGVGGGARRTGRSHRY